MVYRMLPTGARPECVDPSGARAMLCSGPAASLSVNRTGCAHPTDQPSSPRDHRPRLDTPGHSIHCADGAVSVV